MDLTFPTDENEVKSFLKDLATPDVCAIFAKLKPLIDAVELELERRKNESNTHTVSYNTWKGTEIWMVCNGQKTNRIRALSYTISRKDLDSPRHITGNLLYEDGEEPKIIEGLFDVTLEAEDEHGCKAKMTVHQIELLGPMGVTPGSFIFKAQGITPWGKADEDH